MLITSIITPLFAREWHWTF